jgi:hypothetical protein
VPASAPHPLSPVIDPLDLLPPDPFGAAAVLFLNFFLLLASAARPPAVGRRRTRRAAAGTTKAAAAAADAAETVDDVFDDEKEPDGASSMGSSNTRERKMRATALPLGGGGGARDTGAMDDAPLCSALVGVYGLVVVGIYAFLAWRGSIAATFSPRARRWPDAHSLVRVFALRTQSSNESGRRYEAPSRLAGVRVVGAPIQKDSRRPQRRAAAGGGL